MNGLIITAILSGVVALVCFIIQVRVRPKPGTLDTWSKWGSIVGAVAAIAAIIVQVNTSATASVNIDQSPGGIGVIVDVDEGNPSININPPAPLPPTPLPTPTPQSHRFNVPKGGFDSVEFNWVSEPMKEGHQYGAILMKICTPAKKYWVYAEEIQPDPKQTMGNQPFTKDDMCVTRTIAENVTLVDLIRASIGVVGENDQNGTTIPMRSFDIRRTDANDITVTEREEIARVLLEQPITPAEPFGCIDTPNAPDAVLSNRVRIGGWAVADGSVVTKVEVWIDGQFHDTARYGTSRPDLKGNEHAGWYWDWETTMFPNGPHTLEIRVTAATGLTKSINCGPPTVLPVEIKN